MKEPWQYHIESIKLLVTKHLSSKKMKKNLGLMAPDTICLSSIYASVVVKSSSFFVWGNSQRSAQNWGKGNKLLSQAKAHKCLVHKKKDNCICF